MKLINIGTNQTEIALPNGTLIFFSYSTPVAARYHNVFYRAEKFWSTTTSKHINHWLRNYGKLDDHISMPQGFFDDLPDEHYNALKALVEAHDEIPSVLTSEEWDNARSAL